MKSRRNRGASIVPTLSTSSTKANLPMRSMATNSPSPAFSRADLGNAAVNVAHGVTRKALRLGFVAFYLGSSTDAVPIQATRQRGPGQVRDRRLQAIEAIVERGRRVPPEGDDDRTLFDRKHAGAQLLGPIRAAAVLVRLCPFCTGVGLTPVHRASALTLSSRDWIARRIASLVVAFPRRTYPVAYPLRQGTRPYRYTAGSNPFRRSTGPKCRCR